MSLDFITKYSGIRLSSLIQNLSKGKSIEITGLDINPRPFIASAVFKHAENDILILSKSESETEYIYSELSNYGIDNNNIYYYPFSASHTYSESGPDYVYIGERISALYNISKNKAPKIIVAPISSLLQKTIPKENLIKSIISIKKGDTADIDEIIKSVVNLGYIHADVCDHHGVFCKRGGILDLYPSGETFPIRIVFDWGEISEIRYFETESQRSIKTIKNIDILPNREIIISDIDQNIITKAKEEFDSIIKSEINAKNQNKALKIQNQANSVISSLTEGEYFDLLEYFIPYIYPETTLLDYLSKDTMVIFNDPIYFEGTYESILEKINSKLMAKEQQQGLISSNNYSFLADYKNILTKLSHNFESIILSNMPRDIKWADISKTIELQSSQFNYVGKLGELMDDIKKNIKKNFTIVFATAQETRMEEILSNYNIKSDKPEDKPENKVYITKAPIEKGFLIEKLMVIADSNIFGIRRTQKIRKLSKDSQSVSSYLDLSIGDIVVHIENGISIYKGTTFQEVLGITREFLILEFFGGALMYVPTDQIKHIQKYIGGDGTPPVLSKLGSGSWQKAKSKAQKKVEEIAKELVELYAWREALPGYAYSKDTKWQTAMEEAFPYEETASQASAIEDVKNDLENLKPMDRLICGDVGYGKTEVAIRAAFKVTCDNRQVAILAPTTVLAQQHYLSFKQRLAAFPTNIVILSRFQSHKEIKESVEQIKSGEANIIIGTHRILSKDVTFKNLGLLVIDEEQRFGVKHKEKLKQLKKNIDVLTLSATPIPRTLHMSLAGIRSLSTINDPPEGRIPIKTIIKEFDEELIKEAINTEIDRGGQVFFIHNRVESIDKITDKIESLVPTARVDIAHGQMNERELESVMMDFYNGDLDVLVATTIIENGLDVPNANTIIINNADKLGLAQLYQLRGRVGRSNKQAFAYFLYRNEYALNEVAEKRLSAIREFSDLGSGFRIAMRDLEIRGAGNLLGNSQSGSVEAIGFDLYCQLLANAISELKGEDTTEVELPPVDMPINAYIPSDYIPIDAQRILIYKKLTQVTTSQELKDIQTEVIDRFGAPPAYVWNMFSIVEIRIEALNLGIKNIAKIANRFQIVFGEERLPSNYIKRLNSQFPNYTFAYDRLFYNSNQKDCVSDTLEILKLLPLVFKKLRDYIKYL